uniref:hypothetical protein n=1 Tax=Lentilactobacillus hilgardii TaxID=1588 RepID=UPI00403F51E5
MPQLNSEDRLGTIVELFSRLIDEKGTKDFPKLNTFFNDNKPFCSAIRHVNNCYKHSMKLVIVKRNQPFTLDVSRLDGPDTLEGSTKWNIDLANDKNDINQKRQYEMLLHGKNVSDALRKMKSLLEDLLNDL